MLGEVNFSGLSPHGKLPDTIPYGFTWKIHVYILSPDIFKIIVYEKNFPGQFFFFFRFYPSKQKKMMFLTVINAQRRRNILCVQKFQTMVGSILKQKKLNSNK